MLDEDDEFVEEARVRAMEDALEKAEVLAGSLDAKVGQALLFKKFQVTTALFMNRE